MSDDFQKSPYAPPAAPAERSPLHWSTWSPSQSDEVRQILAHMMPEERTRMTISSMQFGLCFGLTFSVPVAMIMYGWSTGLWTSWLTVAGIFLVVTHYAYVPWWVRRQKRLLCDTEWARGNEITSETLPFYSSSPRGGKELTRR